MDIKQKASSFLTPLFAFVIFGLVGYAVYSQWRVGRLGVPETQTSEQQAPPQAPAPHPKTEPEAKKQADPPPAQKPTEPALPRVPPVSPNVVINPPSAKVETSPILGPSVESKGETAPAPPSPPKTTIPSPTILNRGSEGQVSVPGSGVLIAKDPLSEHGLDLRSDSTSPLFFRGLDPKRRKCK